MSRCFSAARPPIRSIADSTHSRRSKGCASMSMRPASIFEKSRMSLMIVSSESPESRMVVAKSRWSSVNGVSSSSPLMPMTAFIGVRISWLIVARKALLASLAASAGGAGLLRLVEQPGVLDGDHGLVGEGLQHPAFLLAERPHVEAQRRQGADHFALRRHRCTQHRGVLAQDARGLAQAVRHVGAVGQVGPVRRHAGDQLARRRAREQLAQRLRVGAAAGPPVQPVVVCRAR